ncbi:ras guanine nucleotide exchange factor P isoform X1 [Drosophila grimshawi]|uniref:ras guanine nucleotide exchange factor P isoform X1 n=1 Tax=Drosophila grimshawi TaxID=7222 RepID=UPI0013EF15C9|nr:ras guanine nucleotide exchange factor P isoform X1 [Drosophila grimshawi]
MQSTVAAKRPGPPVPPRPKTAAAAAAAAATATATATAATVAAAAPATPPIIQKKPTFVSQLSAVGRTLVYKSPSLNLNQKKQAQTQTPTMALVATATTTATVAAAPAATPTTATVAPATAPKPPLKLRKAPAVPTAKPRDSVLISVNRANSLSAQSTPALKDTRLSLGKVDFERAGLLPTTQPLPKPRKIVQLPVATLDMDDDDDEEAAAASVVLMPSTFVVPPATPANSIFRRSKTTLDSPISSTNHGGSYLGGKTVEFKNNLKNAAERLFAEIIISQSQKQSATDTTIITKHERAIQHQALFEQELERGRERERERERARLRCEREQQQKQQQEQQVTIQAAGNCTRININPLATSQSAPKTSLSAGNTPVKKHAFHELLISELAAMRNRSCSLEQLPTKSQSLAMPIKTMPRPRYNSIEDADTEDVDADNVEDADGDEEDTLTYAIKKSLKENSNNNNSSNNNSNNNKDDNLNGSSTPRKRCPSGCSSDSSPYGTERSQRIRTSDWIEVGDNGKQVTLTSCHISLEDSGMEDEERLDDMSSSGVGDSWDSVKEAERENEKRCRNVKRGMSISGLPPLPKSLSGFNKLLGSDSGLLSDVEAQQELENSNNNNNDNNKENESGNKLASQIVSDNKSNNNNLNSDKQASKDSSSKDNANDKSATATAESASLTTTTTPTTATTNLAANASKNENNSTTTTTTTAATATTIITTTKATTTAPSSPAKINVTGSTLDAQIATLRKEMYGLRQLDLSLLSQLWALNDSIQEFRTMIEEQDDEEDDDGDVDVDVELDEQGNRRHSPTPSSYDSVSSEGGVEDADLVMQAKAKRLGTIPKVITTQPKHQQQQQLKSDVKPVPRMRSAPPPPPPVALVCTARKAAAPPRPT